MSVDLHTAQIQGFFDGPVDHLFALPVLADYLADKRRPGDDHRRLARHRPGAARRSAGPTGWARPLAFIHKRRDLDVANQVKVHEVVGKVTGPHLCADRRHDRHRRARSARRPTRCTSRARPT